MSCSSFALSLLSPTRQNVRKKNTSPQRVQRQGAGVFVCAERQRRERERGCRCNRGEHRDSWQKGIRKECVLREIKTEGSEGRASLGIVSPLRQQIAPSTKWGKRLQSSHERGWWQQTRQTDNSAAATAMRNATSGRGEETRRRRRKKKEDAWQPPRWRRCRCRPRLPP